MTTETDVSKDKLWGGRFTQPTDQFVEEFTASIEFDKRLYRQDIRGSIAHARMLGKQGIIPNEDVERIVHGLQRILQQIETGAFDFSVGLEVPFQKNGAPRSGERIEKLNFLMRANARSPGCHLYDISSLLRF